MSTPLGQLDKFSEQMKGVTTEEFQQLLDSGYFPLLKKAVRELLNLPGRDAFSRFLGLSQQRKQEKPMREEEAANLILDCSKPFNVTQFLGEDWKVKEQDERANQLRQVDFAQAQCETCLEEGESCITGEEKLRRLKKAGHVRLGGNQFLALWEDYRSRGADSVLEKLRQRGITYLDFMGLVLRNTSGIRFVLYLGWGGGKWDWNCLWLEHGWDDRGFSVVLPAHLRQGFGGQST